jgi:hypothetical protein
MRIGRRPIVRRPTPTVDPAPSAAALDLANARARLWELQAERRALLRCFPDLRWRQPPTRRYHDRTRAARATWRTGSLLH